VIAALIFSAHTIHTEAITGTTKKTFLIWKLCRFIVSRLKIGYELLVNALTDGIPTNISLTIRRSGRSRRTAQSHILLICVLFV
jgi:hypothetical protein